MSGESITVGCEGKIVVVKFFNNLNTNNSSKLISRTIGKVVFIDSAYKGEQPQHQEFWRVKIIKEINPGSAKGCYIVEPLSKIEAKDIIKVMPGMAEESSWCGTLFVKPNNPKLNWIMPIFRKKALKDVYSIIVELE